MTAPDDTLVVCVDNIDATGGCFPVIECSTGVIVEGVCQPVGCCEDAAPIGTTAEVVELAPAMLPATGAAELAGLGVGSLLILTGALACRLARRPR